METTFSFVLQGSSSGVALILGPLQRLYGQGFARRGKARPCLQCTAAPQAESWSHKGGTCVRRFPHLYQGHVVRTKWENAGECLQWGREHSQHPTNVGCYVVLLSMLSVLLILKSSQGLLRGLGKNSAQPL